MDYVCNPLIIIIAADALECAYKKTNNTVNNVETLIDLALNIEILLERLLIKCRSPGNSELGAPHQESEATGF